MSLVDDYKISGRQLHRTRTHRSCSQGLNRSDLNAFSWSRRKSRLDDSMVDSQVVELPRCLLCQLSAVIEEQHATIFACGIVHKCRCDYCLAGAGWRCQQSPTTSIRDRVVK